MMVQAWFLVLLVLCNAMMPSFSASACPEYFQCGDFGLFSFPFFNYLYPNCGLCMVDCDAQPFPKVRLGGMQGKWYDTQSSLRGTSIKLQDPMLRIHLENRSCKAFTNISLPKTPHMSFSINLNLTIFKCSKDRKLEAYFPGYKLYDSCKHFNLYYIYDPPYLPAIPSDCIAIELPRFPNDMIDNKNVSDLFQLLSYEFNLEWHLSHECSECHLKQGQCQSDENQQFRCVNARKGELVKIVAAAASVGGFVILVILACCFRRFLFYHFIDVRMHKTEKSQNIEDFVKNCGSLAPKRYRYSEVKKMTNSFKVKLGQGGYGSVYKGKLHDCSPVAVKVLKELKGSGEEFINEVASISRTSHVNIVNLLGFCSEGRKRALIYEFMPNGSLDKFIYGGKSSTNRQLRMQKLYKILVGIARGLEYLHSGCNTRILHFDIKPHNILLDRDFTPKISDFGLAKLCPSKESFVSILGARGTAGYIAPEVFCKNFGGVSYKSDVYSYGMMVFEMVGGRKNADVGVNHSSEIYFPDWIYRKINQSDNLGLDGITNEEENELARKMIIVSLWCIQTDPSNRPSMTKVVEMLEGSHQVLQIPPKPFLFSPSVASDCISTVNMT